MRGMKMAKRIPCELNLDGVLRPADAFTHPNEVVCHPDLSINEKRSILASWASDACAVESVPELRRAPSGTTVTFDEIMDALRAGRPGPPGLQSNARLSKMGQTQRSADVTAAS